MRGRGVEWRGEEGHVMRGNRREWIQVMGKEGEVREKGREEEYEDLCI